MKIYFLKDVALETLKANLNEFLPYFAEETNASLIKALKQTLQEVDDRAIFEYSGYDVPDGIEQILIDNYNALRNGKDGENVCVLFDALQDLPPTVACDERFWAGFALLSCWNFVTTRWKMKEDKLRTVSNVETHFFFKDNIRRAITRNALSRLWWIGYITYRRDNEDPYMFTRELCKNSDYIASLFERSYSNSRAVVFAIIEMVAEICQEHSVEYDRKWARPLLKYVNMLGGIYVLETLPPQVLRQKIKAKAEICLKG